MTFALRTVLILLCLGSTLVFSPGCNLVSESLGGDRPKKKRPLTEEELSKQLLNFADDFSAAIQGATDQISKDASSKLKRNAVLWKLRSIPTCRSAALQDDPRISFIDLWSLTELMRQFLEEGQGKDAFDDRQPIAIETSKALVREIERIAKELLTDEQFKKANADLDQFIKINAIDGEHLFNTTHPSDVLGKLGGATFDWALSIPLSPFRALDGIDEGAQAFREFNAVADRFSRYIQEVPSYIRWEAELLFYEVEESSSVNSVLTSLDMFAKSSSRLATTAEGLPASLRGEMDALLTSVEEQRKGLHETVVEVHATVQDAQEVMAETKGAIEDLSGIVDSAKELSAPLESTSEQLAHAGTAWQGAIEAFTETLKILIPSPEEVEKAPPEKEEEGTPFDINDYGKTADSLTATATELRSLFQEFNKTIEEDPLSARLDEVESRTRSTIEASTKAGEDLIQSLTLRAILVIAFAFGLAVVYRFIFKK